MYPLAVPSHLRPRFAYATSPVVTGMRGAKAGVSGVLFFPQLFIVWHRPVSQPSTSKVGPDIPGTILLYDVFYNWHVFVHTECCCRSC